MIDDISSELEAAFEIGQATTRHDVNGQTVIITRDGYAPGIIDTSSVEARTPWPQGYGRLYDEPSFTTYVKRFWRPGESVMFSDLSGELTAIFDYHRSEAETALNGGADDPDLRQGGRSVFGASFTPRLTQSWGAWVAANAREMDQGQFLAFLERRMGDVVTPDGADLFEVIQFFRVNSEIGFSSAKNLANGVVSFTWAEEQTGSGGRVGQLEVPTEFTVRLKPYRDLPDDRTFKVKLRYRLSKPAVKFHFEFFNEELDDFIEELQEQRRVRISGATGAEAAMFFGNP